MFFLINDSLWLYYGRIFKSNFLQAGGHTIMILIRSLVLYIFFVSAFGYDNLVNKTGFDLQVEYTVSVDKTSKDVSVFIPKNTMVAIEQINSTPISIYTPCSIIIKKTELNNLQDLPSGEILDIAMEEIFNPGDRTTFNYHHDGAEINILFILSENRKVLIRRSTEAQIFPPIPGDLNKNIFDFLSVAELARLRQVNRKFLWQSKQYDKGGFGPYPATQRNILYIPADMNAATARAARKRLRPRLLHRTHNIIRTFLNERADSLYETIILASSAPIKVADYITEQFDKHALQEEEFIGLVSQLRNIDFNTLIKFLNICYSRGVFNERYTAILKKYGGEIFFKHSSKAIAANNIGFDVLEETLCDKLHLYEKLEYRKILYMKMCEGLFIDFEMRNNRLPTIYEIMGSENGSFMKNYMECIAMDVVTEWISREQR